MIQESNKSRKLTDIIISLIPTIIIAIYFYGLKALLIIALSTSFALFLEMFIAKFIYKENNLIERKQALIIGLVFALSLPLSTPLWLVILGVIIAIVITKAKFRGLENNIFNPVIAARLSLVIAFPLYITRWGLPEKWFSLDAVSYATPLGLIKRAMGLGQNVPELIVSKSYSYSNLLCQNPGGCIGEYSAIALILGLIYLLYRRAIKPHIPFAIIITVLIYSGIFYAIDPTKYLNPLYSLLTGGLLFGLIYIATDENTAPITTIGQIIFGLGIGLITMTIRYFGFYAEGISFAIIIMNIFVPIINKICKINNLNTNKYEKKFN